MRHRTRFLKGPGALNFSCLVFLVGVLASTNLFAREANGRSGSFRVCADPNNLPYSDRAGNGFENAIAELLAHDLGLVLEYTWWPQRRGFIRSTLNAGKCDVVMGLPYGIENVSTTNPYYSSSYTFLYRKDEGFTISSLDDDVLLDLKIGVHLIGDDYMNSPPAHALSKRGIVDNVVGYSALGDYAKESPTSNLVEAVINKEVNVAILWGPIAGYFASKNNNALILEPILPGKQDNDFLFSYQISMGVREDDVELKKILNALLVERETEVGDILREYGVPVGSVVSSQIVESTGDDQTMGNKVIESSQSSVEKVSVPEKLNPYTNDEKAIAEGEELYKMLNCYSCHGLRGGGGMGPNLTDEQWKEGTGSDERVMSQVMTGRNKMPGYGEVITEEEAWKVIAYVRQLYKGDESTIEW